MRIAQDKQCSLLVCCLLGKIIKINGIISVFIMKVTAYIASLAKVCCILEICIRRS